VSGVPIGPKLTVDGVWIRREKVLLVRRGRKPFMGRWALPGGFVNPDETVEHAVVREVQEETGLHSSVRGIVGVYSGPNRDPRGPTTTVAFYLAGRGGPPSGADDAAEARWVRVNEAAGLAFDHDQILTDALAGLRRTRQRRT